MNKNNQNNSNDNAFKPRTLNEARALFSKQEADTLDMVLSQINKDNDIPENLNYVINLEDYKSKFGLKYDKNAYNKIRDNLKGTGFKNIGLFQEDGSFLEFVLFQSIKWAADGSSVTVKLGEDFKAKLVELKESKKGGTTYYSISYTLPMKSQYSKRLYPMLLEFVSSGWRKDTIESLRTKLQIPESYKYNDIKRFVLDKAVSDINDITDINVSYEEERRGKRVTGIKWNIKKRDSVDEINEELDPFTETFKFIVEEIVSNKVQLSENDIIAIAKEAVKCKISANELKLRLNAILNRQNVNNFVGYAKALINNYEKEKEFRKNSFKNFNEREYDWDEIEKFIINN